MQEPEQPIIMQAEIGESNGGLAMFLWILFLAFWCSLIAASLLAGLPLTEALWKSSVFCLGFCAVIGLVQIAEFRRRQRIRVIVTPSHISLITVRGSGRQEVQQIPVPAVRDVQVFQNMLMIYTDGEKYAVRHFADAAQFADALRLFLRQMGLDIPKTAQEQYYERIELTKKWKRKQEERALMRQEPISATTDEYGQPILPQALTDEQADGVFRPAAPAENQGEEQTHEQRRSF
ncbi:MAG: hypothetical protein J5722_03875 [Oscillospiraceae bacterium]|nr:hypothetical protein [Oscillospiraceae bacterium]